MAQNKKSAMRRNGKGSQIVVRPEAGYLAVVDAREAADDATKVLATACHEKFEQARRLANTAEAAVMDLIGASRLLA